VETDTGAAPRELPIVGGHIVLDFANTIYDPDGPERHDHIASYPALLEWSARVGILTATDADELTELAGMRRRAASTALRTRTNLRLLLGRLFTDVAAGQVIDRTTGRRCTPMSWQR